jgi:hypothetical protein
MVNIKALDTCVTCILCDELPGFDNYCKRLCSVQDPKSKESLYHRHEFMLDKMGMVHCHKCMHFGDCLVIPKIMPRHCLFYVGDKFPAKISRWIKLGFK